MALPVLWTRTATLSSSVSVTPGKRAIRDLSWRVGSAEPAVATAGAGMTALRTIKLLQLTPLLSYLMGLGQQKLPDALHC